MSNYYTTWNIIFERLFIKQAVARERGRHRVRGNIHIQKDILFSDSLLECPQYLSLPRPTPGTENSIQISKILQSSSPAFQEHWQECGLKEGSRYPIPDMLTVKMTISSVQSKLLCLICGLQFFADNKHFNL